LNLKLRNKNVLVTGASRGIGLDIAKKLLSEGCNVVINSRDKDALRKITTLYPDMNYAQGDVTCEVSSKEIIAKTIDILGSLDILICNVGDGKSVPLGSENKEAWNQSFSINLFSAINMIQESREWLAKTQGSIICISSICGHEIIDGAPLTYSVAKNALNFYIKGISKYLSKFNVRINGISPGNILFEGSSWDIKIKENKTKVLNMIKKEVPLNKFGNPENISDAVAFLCSSKANFITGDIWVIDGGQIKS